MTKTAGYCGVGKGMEYTLEEWLKKVQAGPYLDWNDRFHSLYMDIDFEKYLVLDKKYKTVFGEILYDFEIGQKIFPGEVAIGKSDYSAKDNNCGPHLNYEVAKMYVDRFLK